MYFVHCTVCTCDSVPSYLLVRFFEVFFCHTTDIQYDWRLGICLLELQYSGFMNNGMTIDENSLHLLLLADYRHINTSFILSTDKSEKATWTEQESQNLCLLHQSFTWRLLDVFQCHSISWIFCSSNRWKMRYVHNDGMSSCRTTRIQLISGLDMKS